MLAQSVGKCHGYWLKQALWIMDFLLQTCRCSEKVVLVLEIALMEDLLSA